ncbi:MAG: glycoside hydrolase family 28 protein [Butyrivibrio sp.]|nr:glycoside hydrolase family 28 protein [Acetatifactor muris]MCM1558302.1 glycoside hydrolase family 28 protein [Butyrivibrio sp.]
MEVRQVMVTSRSAVIEISDGGKYFTKGQYRILINGREALLADKTIVSLYDLKPENDYAVEVYAGAEKQGGLKLRTAREFVTLDVRRFGAKGDGIQDDTHAIQAAILACPKDSRVLIPAGTYRITSLFLKSHTRIELAEGAELKAFTEREKFPVFPGMIESYDQQEQYNLGSWEGNPLPMYTGVICGVDVEDVVIYGRGTINGNASKEDWWKNPKGYKDVFRPRLFFINGCRNVTLQGVTCCNSPAWTLHPYFSDDLKFIDLQVLNPADSPNTDGCDPESCKNVDILGVRFSLGDDCIAVKSGKIYMGRTYRVPSENIRIRQCLMENGHGAVTLGSEMAGGILNLTVEDCIFRHTDRGLRVKTRRGRGKDAVLNNIVFRGLELDHVMTPLVVNSFYFCDPDGKTSYVQSRDVYPVDDRTPSIKKLVFEDMKCTNCHVAAAYFDGLPEQKIEEIVMRNISFSYAEDAKCGVPAMSVGVPESSRRGLYARNVSKLTLDNVVIEGQDGEAYELEGVDSFHTVV